MKKKDPPGGFLARVWERIHKQDMAGIRFRQIAAHAGAAVRRVTFRPLEGVDGVSVPSGAQLFAARKRFAGRYLSTPGNPKNLSAAEARDLHAHQVGIVMFFETTGTTFTGGYKAGVADARSALSQLKTISAAAWANPKVAVYFTVDTDPSGHEAAIVDYIKGAASVIGWARTGVYGGWGTVTACFNTKACKFYCQAFAWSYGRWHPAAHLRQYQNGAILAGHLVDLERQMRRRAGLWL